MSLTKEQILDAVAKMSVIDIVELISMMEEKFKVSINSANYISNNNAVDKPAEIKEEKTEFNIILNSVGMNKIAVIKAVRGATSLGLKEAKDLVESAPVIIKEGINKDDAEKLKKILEEVGASVEVK